MNTSLLDKKDSRLSNNTSTIHHTFLLNEQNANLTKAEFQALKQYHDQFFKEFCISDLTNYKSNQVALRWRTKKEVISGKGESICADKNCTSIENLKTWEVNFKYFENGNYMNTLVKLRLCGDCSVKLNYRTKKKCLDDVPTIKTEKITKDDLLPESTSTPTDCHEEKEEDTNLLFERILSDPNISLDKKINAYLADLF